MTRWSNWRLARKFQAAARIAPKGPLADYYAAGLADFDSRSWSMAAIDLETDGLDARNDPILELGFVTMTADGIDLGTAQKLRFRPNAALREGSVIVHGITDDALIGALERADALAMILPHLAGRVLVAHFAQIEAAFLDALCRRIYGAPFVAPFICTFQLETRWFPKPRRNDELRLGQLRATYNLPYYSAHDGLIDAIACGELLMAQRARKNDPRLRLGELIRR